MLENESLMKNDIKHMPNSFVEKICSSLRAWQLNESRLFA